MHAREFSTLANDRQGLPDPESAPSVSAEFPLVWCLGTAYALTAYPTKRQRTGAVQNASALVQAADHAERFGLR